MDQNPYKKYLFYEGILVLLAVETKKYKTQINH